MTKIFRQLKKLEKVIIILLVVLIIISSIQLVFAFYDEHSDIIAVSGGIYKEGIVGNINLINPVFSIGNDTEKDITRLIFSGLIKYNPKTKKLEDDIATHTLSADKKLYTFILKDNVMWHDGVPVLSDDIMFTYQTVIQNQEFSNTRLREAFNDVEITKTDDKTVTFFLSNLTIGLLPKHILGDVPVTELDKSDFNIFPIGTGPYQFMQLLDLNTRKVLVLEVFAGYYDSVPYIENLELHIYQNFENLFNDISNLDGVKKVPKEYRKILKNEGKYHLFEYDLNQYVAVFINTTNSVLKNKLIRLGLQLGTNKQQIIDTIREKRIIDTPLLEIDIENWIYQFDPTKAAGAFYDTEWKIPGKNKDFSDTGTGSDTLLEKNADTSHENSDDEDKIIDEKKYITEPNNGDDWITDETGFYITGENPAGTKAIYVNNYRLKKFSRSKGTWSFRAERSIGNLRKGENVYKIYALDKDNKKVFLDEIKVTLIMNKKLLAEKLKKQKTGSATEIEDEKTETSAKEENKKEDNEEAETKEDFSEDISQYEGIIRENSKAEKLEFTLITSDFPSEYAEIAELLKSQWRTAGLLLHVEVLDRATFQEKVFKKEYDLLLFGQNLGHNLDAYPYWHSSQVDEEGLNLSFYTSLEADLLLQEIRETHDEKIRSESLDKLQEVISKEIPAVFLYTPTYVYAVDRKIKNIQLNNLGINSDRFNSIDKWFIKGKRKLKSSVSWFDFGGWVILNFRF